MEQISVICVRPRSGRQRHLRLPLDAEMMPDGGERRRDDAGPGESSSVIGDGTRCPDADARAPPIRRAELRKRKPDKTFGVRPGLAPAVLQ